MACRVLTSTNQNTQAPPTGKITALYHEGIRTRHIHPLSSGNGPAQKSWWMLKKRGGKNSSAWCLSSSVLNQSHFCLFSLSVVFAKSSTTFTSVYTNYRVGDLNKDPRNFRTTHTLCCIVLATFAWATSTTVSLNINVLNRSFLAFSFICHQIKVKESSKLKPNHTHLNSKHVYFISVYVLLRWAPVWISSQWIKACFSWYDPWQRAKTVWRQTELFS